MTRFIGLLRAVNVGGTGKLPMSELRALCERAGFANVRTVLASGNVVFDSDGREAEVKSALAAVLARRPGRAAGILLRSAAEMAAILAGNPFPGAAPNHTVAIFLEHPVGPDLLEGISGRNGEEIRFGAREIYVHYAAGIARSKLKIAGARGGTARNMNTVARLVALAGSG